MDADADPALPAVGHDLRRKKALELRKYGPEFVQSGFVDASGRDGCLHTGNCFDRVDDDGRNRLGLAVRAYLADPQSQRGAASAPIARLRAVGPSDPSAAPGTGIPLLASA